MALQVYVRQDSTRTQRRQPISSIGYKGLRLDQIVAKSLQVCDGFDPAG